MNFSAPLQLLARRIRFRDPVSARQVSYESERRLLQALPGATQDREI
jgi:hypothetical protein